MPTETIIYQEQQKTYFVLIAVFVIIAVFLLAIVLFPGPLHQRTDSQLLKITLLIVTVVDLMMFWSFSKLTIKITAEYLQLGFGIFKRRILFEQIIKVTVEDYQKLNYLGYGIRFGRDKSIGYIARGGRGVRLIMKPRDYFFSSDRPEQIQSLLRSRINSNIREFSNHTNNREQR